jgi:ubiquitin-activating enzyme E1
VYVSQAGAILKAEVYGIPRPEWAAGAAAVAAAAGKVVVPEFVPKKGVKIETDPKVTAAACGCADQI